MNLRTFLIGAFAIVLVGEASTAPVYRWVDANGQIHYSDVVPEAYKHVAQPLELNVVEPTAAEKADADARAAALKAKADAIVLPPASEDALTGPPPSRTAEPFQYTASNCKAWRQRFTESKACFDGLNADDAALGSAAYRPCGEDVPNPYPVCGAPENYDIAPSDYPWILPPPRRRH